MTRQPADQIDDEAMRWVVRYDREVADPELDKEFSEWIAGDTRRQGAYLAALATWSTLDQLSVADWPDAGAPAQFSGPEARVGRRALLYGGVMATLALTAGASWYLIGQAKYSTDTGEIRRIPLADGSLMALNTESRALVEMTDNQRRVDLNHGEAWFNIVKDKQRPFIVKSGLANVRAVGTAFAVRRLEGRSEVIVTEGVVEVWIDGARGAGALLRAGDRAFIADDAKVVHEGTDLAQAEAEVSWRSGLLQLDGRTLGAAAAEFNRYNKRTIVVAPEIAGEKLVGVFQIDDPQGFADAVKQMLDVPVNTTDPTIISIGR